MGLGFFLMDVVVVVFVIVGEKSNKIMWWKINKNTKWLFQQPLPTYTDVNRCAVFIVNRLLDIFNAWNYLPIQIIFIIKYISERFYLHFAQASVFFFSRQNGPLLMGRFTFEYDTITGKSFKLFENQSNFLASVEILNKHCPNGWLLINSSFSFRKKGIHVCRYMYLF